MTEKESKHVLMSLPSHMRTYSWIVHEIAYELHAGGHTYHLCDCKKHQCRVSYCVKCWEEILLALKSDKRFKRKD